MIFLLLSNLLEYYFRLVSICRYETLCVCSYDIVKPWKKCSQKFAQYIAVKKSWISEKDKFLENSPFFVKLCPIFTIFLRRYIQRIFVKLFSWFTYTTWTDTKSFISTDWNQSKIIIEQVGQKQENHPKILLFPIFKIFFTPIYSADFCEILFQGSPIPYKRIKKVSYI